DIVGLVEIPVKHVCETGNFLALDYVGNRDDIMSMGSWDVEGEFPPTYSGMSEESPMGRRDGRWVEVDFSLGGGKGNDDSPVDGRVNNVDFSVGCEVDGGMTLVENVGSSVGEGVEE
ncbi:hypothetical protein KI387_011313, partial [Taxus chinensis]